MQRLDIKIITGLSGSGKSTVLAAFEDAGFYCVDNMPVTLLPKFLEIPVEATGGVQGLAFVMDLREKDFLTSCPTVFAELKSKQYQLEILFLEADEKIIIQRYSQTRRHHPLADDKGLVPAIREERQRLEELRQSADRIIDTSRLTVHDLKSFIFKLLQKSTARSPMRIHVLSFGFKYGVPHDADIIMDVRFLPNPYFDPELKNLDGKSQSVNNYVLHNGTGREFMSRFLEMIDFLVPLYRNEPKAYLTIAIGCTGGLHRSVAVAEAVYDHLRKQEQPVEITHRNIRLR
ncbi:MAG: RNase adapter RapZ [Thermodesulfobacteriota bacterium]